MNALLAQLVERGPNKTDVVGSNPTQSKKLACGGNPIFLMVVSKCDSFQKIE